jgi:hypothetical protein
MLPTIDTIQFYLKRILKQAKAPILRNIKGNAEKIISMIKILFGKLLPRNFEEFKLLYIFPNNWP